MQKKISKTPTIVCCDSLEEQARLTTLLAQDYDDVIGCQLNQFEALLQREPGANVVAGWKQPSAELRLIIDVCREKQRPLLVVIKQFLSNDINRLPERMDYVLLPADSDLSLKPWLEHAAVARASLLAMESEIESLAGKLEERKMIEKAKGLLMKMHNVDEESAYKAMRKSAMQSSQTLAKVAKNILITLETLK